MHSLPFFDLPRGSFSRRAFLRSGCLAAAGALVSWGDVFARESAALGRVTTARIYVYLEPSFKSERIGDRFRDQLLNILEEVRSPAGPAYNPLWYRIAGGYVHSGLIQRVPYHLPNRALTPEAIPSTGILGQVTVPYTRTFYDHKEDGWSPLYRLYYESIHWIEAVVEHADGRLWYRLADAKNDSRYYVPAADLRPLDPREYSPIHRDVPADSKRIVVSIDDQTLTALEGDTIVMQTSISTGVPSQDLAEGEIPTDTPKGYWWITQKMPSRHMGNGRLTSQVDAYELPGVPWTMAFHETGAALHGSFWHNSFGRRMSHGCVNMRNDEALWLFRWTDPVFEPNNWYVNGLGTRIQVK